MTLFSRIHQYYTMASANIDIDPTDVIRALSLDDVLAMSVAELTTAL